MYSCFFHNASFWEKSHFGPQCITWCCNCTVWPLRQPSSKPAALPWGLAPTHYIYINTITNAFTPEWTGWVMISFSLLVLCIFACVFLSHSMISFQGHCDNDIMTHFMSFLLNSKQAKGSPKCWQQSLFSRWQCDPDLLCEAINTWLEILLVQRRENIWTSELSTLSWTNQSLRGRSLLVQRKKRRSSLLHRVQWFSHYPQNWCVALKYYTFI